MALEFLSIFCMINDKGNKDEDSPDKKCLKDRRTPRIVALPRHCRSAFIYLFNSGNEQALPNCCGVVDHKVFSDLLELFQPVFDIYTTDKQTERIPKLTLTKNGARIVLPNKEEMKDCISAIGAKYPALHEN
eukprot:jgi/Psemu1/8115/gm1.8115_g